MRHHLLLLLLHCHRNHRHRLQQTHSCAPS